MTVGELIQALWGWPVWLVLGVAITIAASTLLATCVTVMLIESREHRGTLPDRSREQS